MVDGFQGLRHDAVVGRHHQDDDVGDLGAAGTHAGEGFVAGRVDEDDLAALHLHLVGADVLGDAAGFAARHIGLANGVEQRGLTVIDVAHDGDHGSAAYLILRVFGFLHRLHGFDFVAHGSGGSAEIARDIGGQFGVQRLVDGHENSAVHQFLHHHVGLHVELFAQLFDRDAFGDGDFAADGRRPGFHMAALRPENLLFLDTLALLADGALAGTSARRLHRRRRQTRLDAAARSGMLRPGTAGTRRGGRPGRTPGLATMGWPGRMGPR